MKRREFIFLASGAAVAVSLTARAQQKAMPLIGLLGLAPGPGAPWMAPFYQGLGETGYIEGQNLAIEYRVAEGHYDRFPALAADLVGRKVDVILTGGGTFGSGGEKTPPRRSRSSLSARPTRSRPAWSPVSPGRAAT